MWRFCSAGPAHQQPVLTGVLTQRAQHRLMLTASAYRSTLDIFMLHHTSVFTARTNSRAGRRSSAFDWWVARKPWACLVFSAFYCALTSKQTNKMVCAYRTLLHLLRFCSCDATLPAESCLLFWKFNVSSAHVPFTNFMVLTTHGVFMTYALLSTSAAKLLQRLFIVKTQTSTESWRTAKIYWRSWNSHVKAKRSKAQPMSCKEQNIS